MARPALSASRAVAVLNFLAAHPAEGFTLSELAARLGINVASTHALLGVLTDAGYLVRHPRLRTYSLGPSVVALGTAALEGHPVIDLARAAAHQLAADVGLEVAVTAPAGDDIVFVARVGEHRARGMSVHVGQRVPLAPPLGSVFVAWGAAERWLAQAADRAAMAAVLAAVRARGYSVAVEVDARRALGRALDQMAESGEADAAALRQLLAELGHGEYQVPALKPTKRYDISLIAAPVFGAAGEVVLALTLLGFPAGLSGRQAAAYGEQLRDVGLVVTKQSGGRPPGPPLSAEG